MIDQLNAKDFKSGNYSRYVSEVVAALKKDVEKDLSITCTGRGGIMPQDVEQIDVFFHCYKPATIEEARELIIEISERFLKLINNHEKLRKFLREYPFKQDRIRISISFRDQSNDYQKNGSVAYVYSGGKRIIYDYAEIQKIMTPLTYRKDGSVEQPREEEDEVLVTKHAETYEEALKLYQSQRSS